MASWKNRDIVVSRICEALEALGVEPDDNFKGTPERFADYLYDHFRTDDDVTRLGTCFKSDYRGMVVEAGIIGYGVCPHHLLPVFYDITIGYIANGYAVGVSKLARMAQMHSKRPALQEDITERIADQVEGQVKSVVGVGVVVVGRHTCMSSRGVKVLAPVTTSAVRGTIRESASAKEEFLTLAKWK